MLGELLKVLSFRFDDRPMGDSVYESHRVWIQWLHDYYLRVSHIGALPESVKVARREHVILISNHALTIEALLINYILLLNGAGHVGTMVYREAFKLPFVREFFRSTQCVPISVENGVQTLRHRHILLFPEGMDFLSGLQSAEQTAPYHTGFLRMALEHMKKSRRRSMSILPVAHAGIEKMLSFWVVKNKLFMNRFIRPFVKYPFWMIPKSPLIMPSKVVVNWGEPVRVTRAELGSERKLRNRADEFHDLIVGLRKAAELERERSKLSASLPLRLLKDHDF